MTRCLRLSPHIFWPTYTKQARRPGSDRGGISRSVAATPAPTRPTTRPREPGERVCAPRRGRHAARPTPPPGRRAPGRAPSGGGKATSTCGAGIAKGRGVMATQCWAQEAFRSRSPWTPRIPCRERRRSSKLAQIPWSRLGVFPVEVRRRVRIGGSTRAVSKELLVPPPMKLLGCNPGEPPCNAFLAHLGVTRPPSRRRGPWMADADPSHRTMPVAPTFVSTKIGATGIVGCEESVSALHGPELRPGVCLHSWA